MKRGKVNKTLDLKHRLKLVRETVRELTPDQLKRVVGGPGSQVADACTLFTYN